jgi:hypothetical protein
MNYLDLHDLLIASTIAAGVSAAAWVTAVWVTLRRGRS